LEPGSEFGGVTLADGSRSWDEFGDEFGDESGLYGGGLSDQS